MYEVKVAKECSCFKKSDLKSLNEFDNEEKALECAVQMKDKMNNEFCSKHSFQVLKIFDTFTISFTKPLEKSLKCCGSGCCN